MRILSAIFVCVIAASCSKGGGGTPVGVKEIGRADAESKPFQSGDAADSDVDQPSLEEQRAHRDLKDAQGMAEYERRQREAAELEAAKAKQDLEKLNNQPPAVVKIPVPVEIETPSPSPDPIPDVTLTLFYKHGIVHDAGYGSYASKSVAYTFPKPTFESIVQRGLSCDLTQVSEAIYSCDYTKRSMNCFRACWTVGAGKEVCTECRTPSLEGNRESFSLR